MAIDFPASPTVGQEYTSGGMTYVYNGTGWTIKGGTTLDWVLRAGDTMTGALVLPSDPASALQASTKQYVDAVRTYVDTQNTAQNTSLDAAMKVYAAPLNALAYNGMQVNGSMEVSQEFGIVGSGAIANTSKYAMDGWVITSSGVQVVVGQQITSAPVGYKSSFQLWVATANAAPGASDHCVIRHHIEGHRVSRLAWGTVSAQPITIGFWISSTRAGLCSGSVGNGALNRYYIFTFNINAAGTWEYKTITIPGDVAGTWATNNTVGMVVYIACMVGSGWTGAAGAWGSGFLLGASGGVNCVATTSDGMLVTGFVVLPGTQAPTAAQSPLIMRPYDQELLLCQRYYECWENGGQIATMATGVAQNATDAILHYQMMSKKRVIPTLSYSALSHFIALRGTWASGTAPTQIASLYTGPVSIQFKVYTTGMAVGEHIALSGAVGQPAKFIFDARL